MTLGAIRRPRRSVQPELVGAPGSGRAIIRGQAVVW
jgi:hypothetical protein